MTVIPNRLDALRGSAVRERFNARSLAALENNPRCALRAAMDASGTNKSKVAEHAGFAMPSGQSPFAFARGNTFEMMVKANGAAELLRVLRETLQLSLPEVGYEDLADVGGDASTSARHTRTAQLLANAALGTGEATLYNHPMLRLTVGGHPVFLEPDLVAFRVGDQFHIIEIKSFPILDGQADPALVRSATSQAAAYIIALRTMLADYGIGPEAVSETIVLVAPRNFTNRPSGAFVDARKQVRNLARQLARIARIDDIVDVLPPELTFDLAVDATGVARRPVQELVDALDAVDRTYRPGCLSDCEMALYCRSRARACGSLDILGPGVREDLGGIDSVTMALGLARDELTPSDDQVEIAAALRHAARLRAEVLASTRPATVGSAQ